MPKAQYAATFLFITSVCFAKLSLVAFLRNLTPLTLDRRSGLIIGLVVILWAATAIVSAAFQCHLPKPWDYIHQSCFDRVSSLPGLDSDDFSLSLEQISWANYVAIMNILTDLCLIVLPLVIVARLKAANNKKVILTLFFVARVW